MNEPSLFAMILIGVFMVGLALYANAQPTVPSREQREHSELLALLKSIEAGLGRRHHRGLHPDTDTSSAPDVPPDAFTRHNRDAVGRADVCACLHCLAIFPRDRIHQWDDDGRTACCPYCARPMLVAETQTEPLNARHLLRRHRAVAAVDALQDPRAHHDDQH
jgi:hypothetical protein